MTDRAGRLPDFLVVGAAKSGTTSLARHLRTHPDVYIPLKKELHFFNNDANFALGPEWYAAQFADGASAAQVGEATPTYMYNPLAVERMHDLVPGARLMVMLRHPVERAYSHYWHMCALGLERRPFDAVIADPDAEAAYGYVARGRYAEQLRRLYSRFPPEQVRVILLDDLEGDPATVMGGVCRYLGIDPAFRPPDPEHAFNRRFRWRSTRLRTAMLRVHAFRRWPRAARAVDRLNTVRVATEPMSTAARERLLATFAEPDAELAAMLGRDLPGWDR